MPGRVSERASVFIEQHDSSVLMYTSPCILSVCLCSCGTVLIGRIYQVHDPTNPDELPVAVWHHLQNWVKHVRAFTHVDAKPHFFLFPVIDKFGGVDIEKRMSAATWQSMFDRIVHDSGLGDKYSNGNFTGHCMRRGGAQWRFGEDPAVKWALQASIWWGGWAEGEAVSIFQAVR